MKWSILRVFRELFKNRLAKWQKNRDTMEKQLKVNLAERKNAWLQAKISKYVQFYHDHRILGFVDHNVKKVKN